MLQSFNPDISEAEELGREGLNGWRRDRPRRNVRQEVAVEGGKLGHVSGSAPFFFQATQLTKNRSQWLSWQEKNRRCTLPSPPLRS